MAKTLKVLGGILLSLAVLGAVLWGVYRWFTHQAIPQRSGTIEAAGIENRVEIKRDDFGVAHIYASNPQDIFFAQGYVHAQERFWQMEFQRRTAAGRLSEIFGEDTLETDKYLRHFGFWNLTAQAYDMLDEATRQIVDAYTAGVNAYIQARSPAKLGLEFALLELQGVELEIEPWTPVDSMIWGEMMIFDQSDRLRTELRNIKLLGILGEERYMDMRPPYRADRPVIIPTEELQRQGFSAQSTPVQLGNAEFAYLRSLVSGLDRLELGPAQLVDLGLIGSAGSNSFVVGPELSTTGMPLLANDPHMGVNMPALWYEVGLHCQEKSAACPFNLRGFSLPGVPGILIGHNDRIAWGLTNASFDAEDVFIERINPQNPDQYEVNGTWQEMNIRREEIFVRGREEPEVLFVRSTRNGVIATDGMIDWTPFSFQEGQPELYELSYAWTALEPVQPVRAALEVNQAQNWAEFNQALQYFEAGKQNWLYADVEGNIGYVMPGNVPVRAGGDGSLPVPGWNDEYIWTGFIPYAEAPRVFNPDQGFIATANNPQVRAEEYPYLLSVFHDRGQRAERVTEMIQGDSDGITLADMISIQTDNKNLSAVEILPYLEPLNLANAEQAAARDRLLIWDAQMTMDSPETALFNLFWTHLIWGIYGDDLPDDLIPDGASYASDYVADLLTEPDSVWWDDRSTPEITETRDDILLREFQTAYEEGRDFFAKPFDEWRWGEIHTITFRNATLGRSGISFIEDIFNRGPYGVHGSESVINKTCWSTAETYEVGCIPALRQVIDLDDLSRSQMIHSVGQSGHPMDAWYDNFIDDWRNFRYHASNWQQAEVDAGEPQVLILEPES